MWWVAVHWRSISIQQHWITLLYLPINSIWSQLKPEMSFVMWQIIWCLIYWNFYSLGGSTMIWQKQHTNTRYDIFVQWIDGTDKTRHERRIKEAETNCVDWNNFSALKLYFNYETGLLIKYIGFWCNWMGTKSFTYPSKNVDNLSNFGEKRSIVQ